MESLTPETNATEIPVAPVVGTIPTETATPEVPPVSTPPVKKASPVKKATKKTVKASPESVKKAPAKKTATKKAPAKKVAKATKKSAKKVKGVPDRGKGSRKPFHKDLVAARSLASAVGEYTGSQMLILQKLKGTSKTSAIDMAELKDRVGIGRENKYGNDWLKGLKALESGGLIGISQSADGKVPEGRKKHHFHIKADGLKLLEKASKAEAKAKDE